MDKRILVSTDLDGTRAAILEDGILVEYIIEATAHTHLVGSIHSGRVQNVLPGMQAAFVDIGLERNAFLYVDDALPLGDDGDGAPEERLTIRDVVHTGQIVLVQVAKEPMGTKGARVTRHITLPGRYLVFMPKVDYVGVSRRIRDERERERLKALAQRVRPAGTGLIVRTVAEGVGEEELLRDVTFLGRLWDRIGARAKRVGAPALVHRDLDLLDRLMRDWFSDAVTAFEVDSREAYERGSELLDGSASGRRERLRLYAHSDKTLFEAYEVDDELEKALRRRVWLKSGGYLVIDQTEALTAIDVNTGKFVGSKNLADTVLRTNLEAAGEIARQVRLRDLGGIIIIDFIDMNTLKHRQEVLKTLETALQGDRTRTQVLGLTQLGLVEVTRKKSKEALTEALTRPCPQCEGRGRVVSEAAMARRVRQKIRRVFRESDAEALLMEVNPAVAAVVIGPGGGHLREFETTLGRAIYVRGHRDLHPEEIRVVQVGTRSDIERQSLPVKVGDVLDIEVEEPHVHHPADGIARIDGYVIDIEDAGGLVGNRVKVQIARAFRTYARAKLV